MICFLPGQQIGTMVAHPSHFPLMLCISDENWWNICSIRANHCGRQDGIFIWLLADWLCAFSSSGHSAVLPLTFGHDTISDSLRCDLPIGMCLVVMATTFSFVLGHFTAQPLLVQDVMFYSHLGPPLCWPSWVIDDTLSYSHPFGPCRTYVFLRMRQYSTLSGCRVRSRENDVMAWCSLNSPWLI